MVKRKKLLKLLMVSLFILCICIFFKSDFFYLKKIEINNNKYVKDKEIEKILNKDKDRNIFLINLRNLEKNVEKNNYIKDCSINLKIPNKIIVNIKEENLIGSLYNYNYKYYYCINENGKIIDKEKTLTKYPLIYIGYTVKNNVARINDNNDKKILINLYNSLKREHILNKVKKINFQDKNIISIICKNNMIITINKNDDMDKKILQLSKIFIDLQNKKQTYGKIDLTYNKYILYNPNYR